MNWDNDKELDKLLEENLGNFEDKPSPWVWDAVVKDVPSAPAKGLSFLHGSGLIASISGTLAVSAIIIVYFLGYFDTETSTKANLQPKQGTEVHNLQEPSASSGKNISSKTYATVNPVTVKSKISGTVNKTDNYNTTRNQAKNHVTNQHETTNQVKTTKAKSSSVQLPSSTSLISKQVTPSQGISKPLASAQETLTQGTSNNDASGSLATASLNSEPVLNKLLKQEQSNSIFEPKITFEVPSLIRMKRDPYLAISNDFMLKFLPDSREEIFSNIFRNSLRKKYSYYAPNGNLAVSMYFQADYITGKASETIAKQRNLAGLGIIWSKNGILFESGLLYCKENRDQKFNLNYNEFVGTYLRIDSIIFHVQSGQLTSTNVMKTDSVFGQDLKTRNLITSSSYTYLSVPLLAGFEQQVSHFAFNIKTGFLVGIQINKNEELPVSPENAKINSINRVSPVFLTTNLQWVLRAGVNWYISDQYGLLLEPGLQGYFSKPYNPAEGKADRPIYFGVKAGIFRKF